MVSACIINFMDHCACSGIACMIKATMNGIHSIVTFHSENDTSEVGRHFLATKLANFFMVCSYVSRHM